MVDPALSVHDSNDLPATKQANLSAANKLTVGRFDIDTSRHLPAFEHNYADAFECYSHEAGVNDHVAIVLKDRYPVRKDFIEASYSDENEHLMSLRVSRAVEWPEDGRTRFVMIFRKPNGRPAFTKQKTQHESVSEDFIRKNVIRPIYYAMRHMADRDLFHGSIRPDTIFLNSIDNSEAMLCECVSSMPGINQPVIYETIERGMADPQGRGIGRAVDDVYAFGVTIAVLLRGYVPTTGKSDQQIIEDKINFGTYAVMTDGLRLSPGLAEFLRATLNDDPNQRWGIEQLGIWVEGNRTVPKQFSTGVKAQRALEFNGKKYLRTRILARDLIENIPEAVKLIENSHIQKWVERALNDPHTAEAVNTAAVQAQHGGKSTGYDERLVCLVSMALDPLGPIRLKELKVMPSGIGYSLAYAMLHDLPVQTFGDLIRDRYAWMWLNAKAHAAENVSNMQYTFDQCSKTIIRRGIDHGIERCLYELCADAPCLSELFKDMYVINCNALLLSLDKIANNNKGNRPLDRHIASFITARDNRDNTGMLSIIEGSDPMRRSLAMITMFQNLQKRFENPKLENLSAWLAKDAETVVERYHSKTLKQDILKSLPKEIKSGDLSRVMVLIDSPAQVRKDEMDFRSAEHKYAQLGYERDTIRNELDKNKYFGFDTGHYVALMISLIFSGIAIASTLMVMFSNMGH